MQGLQIHAVLLLAVIATALAAAGGSCSAKDAEAGSAKEGCAPKAEEPPAEEAEVTIEEDDLASAGSGLCTIDPEYILDAGDSEDELKAKLATIFGEAPYEATHPKSPLLIRNAAANWPIVQLAKEKGWAAVQARLVEVLGEKAQANVGHNVNHAYFPITKGTPGGGLRLQKYMENNLTGPERGHMSYSMGTHGNELLEAKDWSMSFPYTDYFTALNSQEKTRFEEYTVFSLGGDGDGLPFHGHTEAFMGLVHGKKQWLMMKPVDMTEEILGDSFNVTRYLTKLFEEMDDGESGQSAWPKGMMFCEQKPGDLLYVPFNWWHATRNIGITFGLGATNAQMMLTLDLISSRAVPHTLQRQMSKVQPDKNTVDNSSRDAGLDRMLKLVDVLPSYFLSTYMAIIYHHAADKDEEAIEVAQRMLVHLRSLEDRGGIDRLSLGALFGRIGEIAMRSIKNSAVAVEALEESLRYDHTRASMWHNAARAFMKLPESEWPAFGFKGETAEELLKKKVMARLQKSLDIDPKLSASLKVMATMNRTDWRTYKENQQKDMKTIIQEDREGKKQEAFGKAEDYDDAVVHEDVGET